MIILSPRTALFALSLCTPLLASCERAAAPQPAATAASSTAATTSPETVLGRTVDSAMRKARTELETRNLDLSHGVNITVGDHNRHFNVGGANGLPHAEVTPQGDLLIDGKMTSMTSAQHALLMDYRRQVISVAETGMAVGVQGADLAGKAVLEVVAGVLHGDTDAAGKRIEAEGKKIEVSAKQICLQLPAMFATQQQLATSLPAFAPYATMKQADIEDCMKGDGAAVTNR